MRKPIKRVVMVIGICVAIILLLCVAYYGPFLYEARKMTPLGTQSLIDGVYAVKDRFVNLYLVKSGDRYIAVDAGMRMDHVRQELQKLQIDPQRVAAVLLTHSDGDHTAALSLFSNAVIYLPQAEEQMVNGQTARFLFFKNKLRHAYKVLADHETIELLGLKIKGIATPGHTPGAMCYLVNGAYLFTGDTISLKNGETRPFNEFFNMDTETQRKSINKLAELSGVQYVFTAHYGYTDDFQTAFKGWTQ